MVILKWILEKKNAMAPTGFVCIRIGNVVDVGESYNEILSSAKHAKILTREGALEVKERLCFMEAVSQAVSQSVGQSLLPFNLSVSQTVSQSLSQAAS